MVHKGSYDFKQNMLSNMFIGLNELIIILLCDLESS